MEKLIVNITTYDKSGSKYLQQKMGARLYTHFTKEASNITSSKQVF